MTITLYIYSIHERMKVWMKKTTIYQFEEYIRKVSTRYIMVIYQRGETLINITKKRLIYRLEVISHRFVSLIGCHGKKSLIFLQFIAYFLAIFMEKKNAFPLSQTTHPSHLDLCLGLPLLQSPAPFSTLPIYKNSYNLCPLRQLCHLLIYTKCIYIKSQHKRIFLRIN